MSGPRDVGAAFAVDLVVPTIGRPSLHDLLAALDTCLGDQQVDASALRRIVLADDRSDPTTPLLATGLPARIVDLVTVVASGGRGPAAARNTGWHAATAPWVAFLDDDVLPPGDWWQRLQDDLVGLPAEVAASQGRIRVPLPTDRRPTDWERNVAGLETARWATADMAYRREVLEEVGGFDERFPRAYREDADLGLRVVRAGYRIVRGEREMVHPVRPSDATVSLRMQAGNAEDPFMRALHGRRWRRDAGVPRGRRSWHLATTGALGTAVAGLLTGRRRLATGGALAWLGLTADLAWRRISPGPRTREESIRMLATSTVLPLAATGHWVRGVVTLPRRLTMASRLVPRAPTAARPLDPEPHAHPPPLPAAVFFDRDGTLIHDVPYNGDPDAVRPVDGAREALDRLRDAGVPTAVVTNQSGIGRGRLSPRQVEAVNARVETLLGPLGPWLVCPHAPEDGCVCRKPSPTLVERAARALGVQPRDCVVIGDIGSDVEMALAAGARPIMVPTEVTRPEETLAAPEVATGLVEAVDRALSGTGTGRTRSEGDVA